MLAWDGKVKTRHWFWRCHETWISTQMMGRHTLPKVLLLDRSRTANAIPAVSDTIRNDLPIHLPPVAPRVRRSGGQTPVVSQAQRTHFARCVLPVAILRSHIPKNMEASVDRRSVRCRKGICRVALVVSIPALHD